MEAIIVDIFLLYFCWRGPYLPWLKVPDLLSWSKIPDLPFFHQRRELIDALSLASLELQGSVAVLMWQENVIQ
jgi:hypothetical protein